MAVSSFPLVFLWSCSKKYIDLPRIYFLYFLYYELMKVFEKIKHSMQKWCCWHPIYLLKSGANKACGISLSSVLVASIYYITLYNDYTQYRRGLKAVLHWFTHTLLVEVISLLGREASLSCCINHIVYVWLSVSNFWKMLAVFETRGFFL